MRIDVVTLFPGMFRGLLEEGGVVQRAMAGGLLQVQLVPLRDFADDRHRTVDDTPFGGGSGMVLKAEPLLRAVESLPSSGPRRVILLAATGRPLTQDRLVSLAREAHVVLVCGRYEGVDARFAPLAGAEEISLGPFVLAGGEIAAMALLEGAARLIPGSIGDPGSLAEESFTYGGGLLEYPQFTRPPEVRGMSVPAVLLSGDHERVARWRRRMALRRTARMRPDLVAAIAPGETDGTDREGDAKEDDWPWI